MEGGWGHQMEVVPDPLKFYSAGLWDDLTPVNLEGWRERVGDRSSWRYWPWREKDAKEREREREEGREISRGHGG